MGRKSLEHNPNWVERAVEDLSDDRGVQPHLAFAAWCLALSHNVDVDDALEDMIAEVEGESAAVAVFRDDTALGVHVWYCAWKITPRLKQEVANVAKFAADCVKGKVALKSPYGALLKTIREASAQNYELWVNLAAPVELAPALNRAVEAELRKHNHTNILIWGPEEMRSQDVARLEEERSLSGVDVEFSLASPPMQLDGGKGVLPRNWKAVVASVHGSSLARAVNQHQSALFHSNVRYALGHKQVRIRSIHSTLLSREASKFFWLYNNGITLLADNFELRAKSVVVTNPQVVNGCQTVSTFGRAYPAFGDEVTVLARIICPPRDKAGQLTAESQEQATLISERTNSQVPVLGRDLKSSDPVHKHIAWELSKHDPPWFYEVKRGEWTTLPLERRRAFSDRRVDLEQLGQSVRMLSNPAAALTRKRDLFEEQGIYGATFSRERSADQLLFAEVTRRHFSRFWSARNFAQIRNLCGEQFTDSALRRILRARGQVVAHSVGLTGRLVDCSAEMDVPDMLPRVFRAITRDAARLEPFAKHIAVAVLNQLRILDAVAQSSGAEETPSLKKHFERLESQTLNELWEFIATHATTWSGKAWYKQMLLTIVDV